MNEIDVHVGHFLCTRRKAAQMSESALATRLAVTVDELRALELGEARLSASQLWSICQVFDVKPGEIFADCLPKPSEWPMLPLSDS